MAEGEDIGPEKQSMSPMILMLVMLAFMFIITGFRTQIGSYMDSVLGPIIGFNGEYPLVTISIASLIIAIANNLLRFKLTDWKSQAKQQHVSKFMGKIQREALKKNDLKTIEAVRVKQKELTQQNLAQMNSQFKIMPITFAIFIPVLYWLWFFIEEIQYSVVVTPWNQSWDLLASTFFPNFLWFYMVVSYILSYILQKSFMLIEWRKWL